MAIPNPPVTPNTSKLHYLLYDNSGTNAAAIWHSVKEITVNTEIVGVAHVGTHVLGATLGGTDAAVVIAGTDSGTIRALAVNADGEVGIHDGGNSLTVDGTVAISGTVPVSDGGGSLTIDGTITANIGTTAGLATETTLASLLTELQDITYTEGQTDTTISGIPVLWEGTSNTLTAASRANPFPVSLESVERSQSSHDVASGLGTFTQYGWHMMGVANLTGSTWTDADFDNTLVATDAAGRIGICDLGGTISIDDGGSSITVDATVGAPLNVQISDSFRTATVRDTGSSDSLNVAIVDASGNQITSFGGSGTQYTEADVDTTITGTAILWEDTGDTLRAVSAAKPLPIGDAGGSITVDGTVAATQSGTWILSANSGVDIGDVTINNASGASAVNIQDGGNSITIDGSVSITGTPVVDTELSAAAALADNTANPTVTSVGTFAHWYDGTTWDRARGDSTDGLLVNLGTNNDVTVTGSVTANAGTNLNTSALALESGGNLATVAGAIRAEDAIHSSGHTGVMALAVRNDAGTAFAADGDYVPLSIDSAGALRVTGGGGGTQYTEADVDASITGTAILWEDTSDTLRAVSAAKPLPVNVVSGPAGGTSATDDGAFTPASGSGTPAMGFCDEAATDSVDEGDVGVLRMTADRKLLTRIVGATDSNRLDVDSSGRLTANLAAGTNNIGDVDVLTVPAPLSTTGGGTEATALRVTLANDSTGLVSVDDNGGSLTVDGTVSISGTVTTTETCNSACVAGAVSVGSVSSTALPASALSSRKRLVIQNLDSSIDLYIGPSGVTSTTGMKISAGWAQALEAGASNVIHGIAASGTINVRVLELS